MSDEIRMKLLDEMISPKIMKIIVQNKKLFICGKEIIFAKIFCSTENSPKLLLLIYVGDENVGRKKLI